MNVEGAVGSGRRVVQNFQLPPWDQEAGVVQKKPDRWASGQVDCIFPGEACVFPADQLICSRGL